MSEVITRVWVATAEGKARHPIPSIRANFEGSAAKQLLCQKHPVHVHVCSPEEIETLPECYICGSWLWGEAPEQVSRNPNVMLKVYLRKMLTKSGGWLDRYDPDALVGIIMDWLGAHDAVLSPIGVESIRDVSSDSSLPVAIEEEDDEEDDGD